VEVRVNPIEAGDESRGAAGSGERAGAAGKVPRINVTKPRDHPEHEP
jgi:hypothetical protein